MAQSADPMRMMYVGILTTLLLLTGCFGLVEDDVIDSTSGEVTDQQFADLESKVLDLELDAAGHSTSIVDLEARITMVENNMLTIQDVMAALPPGSDMSEYLTSNDIASLVADAQSAQNAIQMSAAEIAALEQQVLNLEQDLLALNGGNQGAGVSGYAPIIENFHINAESPFYHDDGNLAELVNHYPEAATQEVRISVDCSFYLIKGSLTVNQIGLDTNHDGIIDHNIPTVYNPNTEMHDCEDSFVFPVDNSEFTVFENGFDGLPFATLLTALAIEDEGAWSFSVGYEYWHSGEGSNGFIEYSEWMLFTFSVMDHPETLGWNSYNDDLILISYSDGDNGASVESVGYGYSDADYLFQETYRIRVIISAWDNFLGSSTCEPVSQAMTSQYSDCEVTSGLTNSWSFTPTLQESTFLTISENQYNWNPSYNDMCQGDYYNSGHTCTLTVSVLLEKLEYQGMINPYVHLKTYDFQLNIN